MATEKPGSADQDKPFDFASASEEGTKRSKEEDVSGQHFASREPFVYLHTGTGA